MAAPKPYTCDYIHPADMEGEECLRFRIFADQPLDENSRCRSELRERKPNDPALLILSDSVPATIDYRYRLLIPHDWRTDPNKVALIHWHHTPPDPQFTVPPLSLFAWNKNLYLRLKNDAGLKDIVKAPLVGLFGQWLDIVIMAKWTSEADGHILVNIGSDAFSHHGPTYQKGITAIYNSIGPYWPEPTVAVGMHQIAFSDWEIEVR